MLEPLYVDPVHIARIEDCLFYHVMEIPGVGVVGDDLATRHGWDLRGHLDEYLGEIPLSGRRILEVGPVSGFLTFAMERRGADVVSVEIAPTSQWDVVPHTDLDLERVKAERQAVMGRLRNGFWFAHERSQSHARVHHGNGGSLPAALGRFDIAVLAAVLLHNRDPLRMVDQCAALADEIVITERHWPELDDELAVAQLHPTRQSPQWDTWWNFTPGLFVQYLEVHGFSPAVSFHDQTHVFPNGDCQIPMFTVVGRRD